MVVLLENNGGFGRGLCGGRRLLFQHHPWQIIRTWEAPLGVRRKKSSILVPNNARAHHRDVFEQVCEVYHDLTELPKMFRALSHVVKRYAYIHA